jgi:hypothetical protein
MFRRTLNVSIVSLLATIAGGEPYGISWQGHVPIELPDDTPAASANADAVNETLFRAFQRVDDADARRLEDLDYRLPSLSCGDLIAWGGITYRVLAIGFERIEPTGAFEATVRHRTPGEPSPTLRALIGEYVESHPNRSTALTVALTALARTCLDTKTDPAIVPVLAALGLDKQTLAAAFR